jgi:VanZ family protein
VSAGIRIITLIYVFVLAGIVILADLYSTKNLLAFVGNIPFGDTIGHFCLMGMFSLLVNLALDAKSFRFWKLNYLLGSLIVLAIVTAEEFSQIFIAGRTFDLIDLLFDYAGIFIFGETSRLICLKFLRNSNFYQKVR